MQATAKNTHRKAGGWKPPQADACAVCTRPVYYMEKVAADNKVYHKTCFKCSECKKTLSTGTYAALDGKVFCKPHFKQLFKRKGRYTFAKDGTTDDAPSSVMIPTKLNLTSGNDATPSKQKEATAITTVAAAAAAIKQDATPASPATPATPSVKTATTTSTTTATTGASADDNTTSAATKVHARAAFNTISAAPSVRDRLSRFNTSTTTPSKKQATPAATPIKRDNSVSKIHSKFAAVASTASSPASMFLPSSRFGMCTTPLQKKKQQQQQLQQQMEEQNTTAAANNTDQGESATTPATARVATKTAAASLRRDSTTPTPSRKGSGAYAVVVKSSVTSDIACPARSRNVRDIRSLFENNAASATATPARSRLSRVKNSSSSRSSSTTSLKSTPVLARTGSTSSRRAFFESQSRNASTPHLSPSTSKTGSAATLRASTTPSTPVSRGSSLCDVVTARKAQMERARATTAVVKGATPDDYRARTRSRVTATSTSATTSSKGGDASVRSAVALFESLTRGSSLSAPATTLRPRIVFGLQQASESVVDAVPAGKDAPGTTATAAEEEKTETETETVRTVVLLGGNLQETTSTDDQEEEVEEVEEEEEEEEEEVTEEEEEEMTEEAAVAAEADSNVAAAAAAASEKQQQLQQEEDEEKGNDDVYYAEGTVLNMEEMDDASTTTPEVEDYRDTFEEQETTSDTTDATPVADTAMTHHEVSFEMTSADVDMCAETAATARDVTGAVYRRASTVSELDLSWLNDDGSDANDDAVDCEHDIEEEDKEEQLLQVDGTAALAVAGDEEYDEEGVEVESADGNDDTTTYDETPAHDDDASEATEELSSRKDSSDYEMNEQQENAVAEATCATAVNDASTKQCDQQQQPLQPRMTRRLSSVLNFSTFVNVNWDQTQIVA
ncbi:LIM domain-containing protein 2 [Salpingoeca rosetta]|uniref:LIM domain-containing protein 2 n=1 Tax=Salpingoeca rosetta (strain ATCC 50818 / BSB-021) TaxID=946362 RepID=F2U3L0_SALR5|nr:LIM domain-containing protein 2 [Salpingoeca rosetta]EGD82204.1 LIM domain-containing protein 2 [Salpingoeca rosetta]|eukprot:XP_004996387.1 LIM domain-containing protein 2 [Salpingoeca rosetta]